MSDTDLAEAAATFLGVPFVLHGRDPNLGLDCVGLVVASLKAIGRPAPSPVGYGLRNRSVARWVHYARAASLLPVEGAFRSGDVVLCSQPCAQFHLSIIENQASLIHAHAGLRKVVRQPNPPCGEVIHKWRLAKVEEA